MNSPLYECVVGDQNDGFSCLNLFIYEYLCEHINFELEDCFFKHNSLLDDLRFLHTNYLVGLFDTFEYYLDIELDAKLANGILDESSLELTDFQQNYFSVDMESFSDTINYIRLVEYLEECDESCTSEDFVFYDFKLDNDDTASVFGYPIDIKIDILNYLNSNYTQIWEFYKDPVWSYSLNWLPYILIENDDFSNEDSDCDNLYKDVVFYEPLFSSTNFIINKSFFLNDSSTLSRSNLFNKFEPLKIFWYNNILESNFEIFNNNLITDHNLNENTYLIIKQKRLDNKEDVFEKKPFSLKTDSFDYISGGGDYKVEIVPSNSWFQDFSFFEIFDDDVIVYKENVKDSNNNNIDIIKRYFRINFKNYVSEHGGTLENLSQTLKTHLDLIRDSEDLGSSPKYSCFTEQPKFFETNPRLLTRTGFIKNSNQPSLLAKRLLRTRRLLVLPTNINISLITNSFDVVHSWYIPGLGIKMDCIPGRSTHHTLHVDNAGFYYGQCAEICGRFHHHMPIRICALPFEHFLIWWYHYGLPYFLAGEGEQRDLFIKNSIRSLNW